ncbi:hypothetical protein [Streptococcus suis]|uniref:hypothetical protein n=2 Tax=Streptococcus suis TaxID=1307 RepID=UPI002FCB3467
MEYQKNRNINVSNSRRKEIYKDVLGYYELNNGLSNQQFDKIRKQIDREFSKKYINEDWSDLTEYQKKAFIISTMKEYMFEKANLPYPDKIQRKIDKETARLLISMEEEVSEYNKNIDNLYKVDDKTKLRPFDEQMSAIYDNQDIPSISLLQVKVDTLLKLFEEEFDYVFDLESMIESLRFVMRFEKSGQKLQETEGMSDFETDRKFLYHLNRLKSSDFYHYKGEK